MDFTAYMLKIGFFVKEGNQVVQNYDCPYSTEIAMKMWKTFQDNQSQPKKK